MRLNFLNFFYKPLMCHFLCITASNFCPFQLIFFPYSHDVVIYVYYMLNFCHFNMLSGFNFLKQFFSLLDLQKSCKGETEVPVQFIHSVMSDLCNPMDCRMLGSHVNHQLPEPTQTLVHQVSDAIQQSHPL